MCKVYKKKYLYLKIETNVNYLYKNILRHVQGNLMICYYILKAS